MRAGFGVNAVTGYKVILAFARAAAMKEPNGRVTTTISVLPRARFFARREEQQMARCALDDMSFRAFISAWADIRNQQNSNEMLVVVLESEAQRSEESAFRCG